MFIPLDFVKSIKVLWGSCSGIDTIFIWREGFKDGTQKSKLIIVVNIFNGKRYTIIYYLTFVSFSTNV